MQCKKPICYVTIVLSMLTRLISVGDGTFLFSQMESTFWISRRYNIPILLIVLNNGGWNAPKVSALLVHKDGLTSKHTRKGTQITESKLSEFMLITVIQTCTSLSNHLPTTLKLQPQPEAHGEPRSKKRARLVKYCRKLLML